MNGTIERRWPAAVLLCLVLFATAGLQPAHAAKGKKPMCLGKRATIVGNAKGNVLRGSKKADVIYGGGGKDKISGGGGADRICGGPGTDSLQGGAGNDRMDGGGGTDTCRQNAGTGSLKSCEGPTYALQVAKAGAGAGEVTSAPAGIACGGACSKSYFEGSTVALTATPAAGSVFAGWSGACSGTGACSVVLSATQSVTATFSPVGVSHPLTVQRDGSGSGTITSSPGGVSCGSDCSESYPEGTQVTLSISPAEGSIFSGWSGGGCTGTGACVVTMDAPKTVTAALSLTRTLNATTSGTGSGTITSTPTGISCGANCSHDFIDLQAVTLTATPDAGSTFDDWSGCDLEIGNECSVTMNTARFVTATFTAATFPMSVSRLGSGVGSITSSPAGITCGEDCSEDFGASTVVTLTATPNGTSVFTGWGGDCSGTSTTCNVTMNAAKTVTAGFAVARTLMAAKDGNGNGTMTSSPAGVNCGSDCTEAYADGQSVTLTAAASAGSTFTAWAGCDSETGNQCTVAMGTNRTVTATFTLLQYTLTVDRAGLGTGTVTGSPGAINCGTTCSDTFNHGQVVTLTATAGANSAFSAWSGDCSGTSTTCNVTMNAAKSVTATFARTFLLTVSKDGTGSGTVESDVSGISCGANCDEAYVEGSSVVLTATPASGSQVAGWTGGGCSGTGSTCTVTMNAAKTVTVTFNRITYALSVSKDGTGDGTVSSNPAGISCGGDCNETYDAGTSVTLTAAVSAGSLFTGWSGSGCSGTSTTCNVTMDGAKAVTATFTDSFVLTVSKAGTGSGTVDSDITGIDCGSDCTQEYVENTVVVLTATPATGSTFAGWSGGGCSGTGTCSVTMNAAKNPTATFTQITHTLTASKTGSGTGSVSSSPAGIDCGVDCSQAYNQGTDVTLTATTDAGSVFGGWSGGGCSGTGTCVVTMSAATTVTATFTKLYTLTVSKDGTGSGSVSSSPSGVSCGGDCSEDYLDGTVVTLTATPSAGSTFTAWTGAGCSGTGTCQVTMSAARSVTATFTQITHTLTVSTTGSGTGSVSSSPAGIDCGLDCSQSYNEGTSVTLTATPGGGSVFSGWSGGGCSGTGSCVVTMDGAKSVTADFTAGRTLTVQKDGSGSGTATSSPAGISCGEDCSEGYLHGATVTLTAGASAGSVFTSWTNCDSPSGSTCEMSMTADKTVTATFTALFTLTVATDGTGEGSVSSSPAGITCGVDCTEDYVDGTSVTLTATGDATSIFAGWSGGGCSGTGTCVVTMDAAKSVTATFTRLTLSLTKSSMGTVTSSPAGINCATSCTSQSANFGPDTVVTLTASDKTLIIGTYTWGGACSGAAATCVVTMSQARSVSITIT